MILELRNGLDRATVSTIGATILSWQVGDIDILDGYQDEAELATLDGYRGAVLAPWSNRIAGGQWNDRGVIRSAATAGNHDPLGLHGLVTSAPFEVRDQSENAVALETQIEPTPGYPCAVALTVRFRLADSTLHVAIEARNDSDEMAPIGLGWHPYFMRGHGDWDIDAQWVIENDELGIPLDYPFRDFHGLDDVDPDWDNALAGVSSSIAFPVRGGRVHMSASLPHGAPGIGIWHLFGGGTLARGAGESVAVEPCTAMTDGLNRLREELDVAPGERVDLSIEVNYDSAGQ